MPKEMDWYALKKELEIEDKTLPLSKLEINSLPMEQRNYVEAVKSVFNNYGNMEILLFCEKFFSNLQSSYKNIERNYLESKTSSDIISDDDPGFLYLSSLKKNILVLNNNLVSRTRRIANTSLDSRENIFNGDLREAALNTLSYMALIIYKCAEQEKNFKELESLEAFKNYTNKFSSLKMSFDNKISELKKSASLEYTNLINLRLDDSRGVKNIPEDDNKAFDEKLSEKTSEEIFEYCDAYINKVKDWYISLKELYTDDIMKTDRMLSVYTYLRDINDFICKMDNFKKRDADESKDGAVRYAKTIFLNMLSINSSYSDIVDKEKFLNTFLFKDGKNTNLLNDSIKIKASETLETFKNIVNDFKAYKPIEEADRDKLKKVVYRANSKEKTDDLNIPLNGDDGNAKVQQRIKRWETILHNIKKRDAIASRSEAADLKEIAKKATDATKFINNSKEWEKFNNLLHITAYLSARLMHIKENAAAKDVNLSDETPAVIMDSKNIDKNVLVYLKEYVSHYKDVNTKMMKIGDAQVQVLTYDSLCKVLAYTMLATQDAAAAYNQYKLKDLQQQAGNIKKGKEIKNLNSDDLHKLMLTIGYDKENADNLNQLGEKLKNFDNKYKKIEAVTNPVPQMRI